MARPLLLAVLALLLASAGPLLSGTAQGGGGPTLTLVREISTSSSGSPAPFQAFDTLTMTAIDLRGDGHLELVAPNDNDFVYVIDPVSGQVLAQLATWRPAGWHVRDIDSPAVGDVLGDGHLEIAHLNSAAQLTVFALDANASGSTWSFHELWNHTVDASRLDPNFAQTHPWYQQYNQSPDLGADGSPFIARLPGEPSAVVAGQSDGGPGIAAYDANGTLRWLNEFGDGDASPWFGALRQGGPWVADVPNDGGHVFVLDAKTGNYAWNFDGTALGADPGSMTVLPLVQDLFGDGSKETFVGARYAVNNSTTDPDWIHHDHAYYFLLNADGSLRWQAQPDWGNPMYFMLPVAVDLNGDGVKDVLVEDWNTIGHNPGNWESTGPANLFALSGKDGSVLWHVQVASVWSNKDVAVARFDPSDPAPEIATETQQGGSDGMGFYALSDGHMTGFVPFPSGWEATRGPLLADLDGSGTFSMIVPLARGASGCPYPLDVGCREGELAVYRTQAPDASAVWTNDVTNDAQLDTDHGYLAVAGGASVTPVTPTPVISTPPTPSTATPPTSGGPTPSATPTGPTPSTGTAPSSSTTSTTVATAPGVSTSATAPSAAGTPAPTQSVSSPGRVPAPALPLALATLAAAAILRGRRLR